LNHAGDLSWSEVVRLSEGSPSFTDLWFSGGEPTLRKDLSEIIDLFVQNNGVRYINLPTNGLKPQRIYEVADHCLTVNRGLELHINLALDGLRESHDLMRGVPGNFDKVFESARLLRQLKQRFGYRLKVHINTVITRDNLDEILPLAELVLSEDMVDGHYFNVIRGDAKDARLKDIELAALRRIYPRIAEIQWRYADNMIEDRNPVSRWIKKAIYVGTLTFHHRTQLANQSGPHAWSMPCTAGETSAVIDYDGRVRACELRQPIGNLRDFDMNLKVFWETPARQQEPGKIACDGCWCSHVCFIHDSLRYSPRTLMTQVPWNFLTRKVW
jgi:MoaA/NifB/PqqE/SkfB family radical SAM enzyme